MSLNDAQMLTLSLLADQVVPPSETHGVPGAGDAAIVAAIIGDAGPRLPRLARALAQLDELAITAHGVPFADLAADQREPVALAFRETHTASAGLVETLTTQCYYRDDRVMVSLGLEARAPHPSGYEVEQGDWSLLDPVRNRSALYRKA